MKTTILKYDYHLQLLLLVADGAVLIFIWYIPYMLLLFQLIIGFYQLCSSALHLFLQHKSIGFYQWRIKHFFGSVLYLTFLILLTYNGPYNAFLFIATVIVIPQAILFAYTLLCKRELNFIEEREFHILK
ncbi:MAG TPA: hypothetical protein VK174_06250 [Chitinophagales bacterium]|nr:hypothetical protein [Chitinophagales bacterium]